MCSVMFPFTVNVFWHPLSANLHFILSFSPECFNLRWAFNPNLVVKVVVQLLICTLYPFCRVVAFHVFSMPLGSHECFCALSTCEQRFIFRDVSHNVLREPCASCVPLYIYYNMYHLSRTLVFHLASPYPSQWFSS